jgi:hypothetical protein
VRLKYKCQNERKRKKKVPNPTTSEDFGGALGATTLSITTFVVMTLGIMGSFATLSTTKHSALSLIMFSVAFHVLLC